jgi:putative flippase GtrA
MQASLLAALWNESQTIGRFAIVGIVNNAVSYLLFVAAVKLTGAPPIATKTVLFAAVVTSYAVNRSWSFAHEGPMKRSFWRGTLHPFL